jgi:hypothetical protein
VWGWGGGTQRKRTEIPDSKNVRTGTFDYRPRETETLIFSFVLN